MNDNNLQLNELDAGSKCANHDLVNNAYSILESGWTNCNNLLNAHNHCCVGDKKDCLDIVKAMFVMSCAAFDACIKAVIENALKEEDWFTNSAEGNKSLRKEYKKWLIEYLKKECEDKITDKLMDLLFEGADIYVGKFLDDKICKGSLLNRTKIDFINLTLMNNVLEKESIDDYKKIFDTRHEIVHKLDFNVHTGNEASRSASEMVGYANTVFELAAEILTNIDIEICDSQEFELNDEEFELNDEEFAIRYLMVEDKINHFKSHPEEFEEAKERQGLV